MYLSKNVAFVGANNPRMQGISKSPGGCKPRQLRDNSGPKDKTAALHCRAKATFQQIGDQSHAPFPDTNSVFPRPPRLD
jgi:hypothetical protein